jgi:hypothetical protein
VKNIVSVIGGLVLVAFIAGLVILYSGVIRNFIFYKSGFTPKEIFSLNDKINSVAPTDAFAKRVEVFKQIDDLAKNSVSGTGFSSNIYSLVKVRLDQAMAEIPQTQVPKGKVKVWYIYNMGIIAKSDNATVAFDLAGTYAYTSMPDFAKNIDILVITHFDGDHFDLAVVREALKDGAIVIIPGDKMTFRGQEFGRDPAGEDAVSLIKKRNGISSNNLISLEPLKTTTIKGVEITAYPAIHIHNPDEGDTFVNPPINSYYIDLSGFNIFYTGDAESVTDQADLTNKNVDLFAFHSTTLDPRTNESLMKLVPNAKTLFPLHVLELGHGSGIVDKNNLWYMNYQSILDNYANGYYKLPAGKTRFLPMIWGESILF